MGWTPEAPAARGQTRDRWESLQALVDQATELAAAGRHRPRATSSTTSTAARPSSTPRWPAASPWPPSTRPRVSSGTPCSWWASARAPCRSPTPSRPPRSRRSAACSTSASPAPAAPSRSPGPGPATRAAAPPASPRGSSTRCCPPGARTQPTGAKSRKVVSCRECGKPLATGPEKKRGRCGDCPASYDEELFEQLRTWRSGQAAEESVPAYVVFTDATLQLIAEHKPQLGRGPAAHQRHRPDQARPLRRRRSRPRGLEISRNPKTPRKRIAHPNGCTVPCSPNETAHAHSDPDKVRARSTEGGGPDDQHPHRDDGQHPVVHRHARLRPRPRCCLSASTCAPRRPRSSLLPARPPWAASRATSRGPLPGDHRAR